MATTTAKPQAGSRFFWWTSIGRKILMAITGIGLIIFLIEHLLGNLLLFVGPAAFNGYSHALISNPFIWVVELGLLGIFILHFVTAIGNYLRNRGARPEGYQTKHWAGGKSQKSVASTTMIVTGIVTLVFVPLHLLTFKYGPHYVTANGQRDLYRLVVQVFHEPGYVIWYVVALALLGFHLWHGFGSAFRTLGVHHRRWSLWWKRIGWLFSLFLAAGFITIPLAVITGIIH